MTSMTGNMSERAGLQVAQDLATFIEERALPGTGIDAGRFWQGTAAILARFAPENAALLARRDALQARIDGYYEGRTGQPVDTPALRHFLEEIGYLVPEPAPFQIGSEN